MELLKNIFFINLNERTDRLDHVTTEFNKMNLTAEKVKGIKLDNGALGCTLSHIKCLKLAKERKYEHVFICEDDIEFLNPPLFLEKLNLLYENKSIYWDVLVVGGNTVPPYKLITEYCIRVSHSQTTTGYIVKNTFYDILINNFTESANKLMANPTDKLNYALDRYWLQLQKQYHFCMLIPPTVVQYESYSDIEESNKNYKDLMLDMNKEWLFKPTRPKSVLKFT
tara:strand:+ start:1502 stop:2176 length:675 start_codon:yes stop_codon:yes gene_type:complete